jgi:hypothetical protein
MYGKTLKQDSKDRKSTEKRQNKPIFSLIGGIIFKQDVQFKAEKKHKAKGKKVLMIYKVLLRWLSFPK